jgi:hypothetical protein
MKISHVAGNVKGGYLTFAVQHLIEATQNAANY